MSDENLQQKAAQQLHSLLADCGITDPQGMSILEIGFKNGLFLAECLKKNMKCTGLEIEPDYARRASKRFPEMDLLLYDGLDIPLSDNTFDLIVSYQVLEHVQSIQTTIQQSIRLLKPGGIMYHACPNYRSFYEGHFKVVWMPFLGRKLGRIYLKMRRRYRDYYETLNIVTPNSLRKILGEMEDVETISLGRAEFKRKFDRQNIEKVQSKPLQCILKTINRMGPLKTALIKCIAASNMYYPITLIASKRKNEP